MKKLLLDTNVLLLFLVGNHLKDPSEWKRLSDFDNDDLKRVNRAALSAGMVTLPNILTEASNLLGSGSQQGFSGAAHLLLSFAQTSEELFKPSREVMNDPTYNRLGLTDAAIYVLADERIKVLTIDIELTNRLALKGVQVENLRHYKTPRHPTPSRKRTE